MPPPASKNIFLFYQKIHLNLSIYSKTNQKKVNDTIVIVNYKNKKYAKYISMYIKIKIVEILKYGLSYVKYYMVIYIRELIIILDH